MWRCTKMDKYLVNLMNLALLEQLASKCFFQKQDAKVIFQRAAVPLQTSRKSDTSETLDLGIYIQKYKYTLQRRRYVSLTATWEVILSTVQSTCLVFQSNPQQESTEIYSIEC